MATDIHKRVKEAVEKSDAKKGRKRKKRDKISPEFFAWMIWAIMLDILGLLLAGLTLITGGLASPLGFIPDIVGTATIGVQAWKDEGRIPMGKKSMKLLRKYGWEWIPVIGGAPLWTFFVFKDF